MDRFAWTSGLLELGETLVVQQRGVRLYDGEEKVMEAARRRAPGPGPGGDAAEGRPSPGGCGDRRGSAPSGAPQGGDTELWGHGQLLVP